MRILGDFKIAPDNTPYIVYDTYAANTDNKISVKKFNGSSWVNVGNLNFSTEIYGSPSLAINSTNQPYVAFQEENNNRRLKVMRFHSNSWVNVGSAGISSSGAGTVYIDLAFDASNNPYVAYEDVANGEKMRVKRYVFNSWVDFGIAGISSGVSAYPSLTFDNSNIAYLAYVDFTNGERISVKRYTNGVWSQVGNAGFSPENQTSYPKVVISNDNRAFISFRFVSNSNSRSSAVMKFNGSSWISLGAVNVTEGQSANYQRLAIDNNNIPYLIYNTVTNPKKISVKKYVCNSTLEADFYASVTAVPTGSVVDFLDTSTNNPTIWTWSFSPNTVTYVNGTDNTSQNPKVTFNNEGLYTVSLLASNSDGSDTETKTEYITVDNLLSIDEEELSSIVIYPNPTDDLIYIKNTLNVKIKRIEVYDLTGKLLSRIDDNPQSISFKDYANGIYLIQIKSDNGKVIKRIIKK